MKQFLLFPIFAIFRVRRGSFSVNGNADISERTEKSRKNSMPYRKKFIAITNTNKENFVRAFGDQVNGEPDILFLAAKDFGKISLNGDLCDDPRVIKTIKDFIG